MPRLARFLAALLIATPASAHDFWLQPRSWQATVGTPLPFTVEVGHGGFRERWSGKADRLVALRHIRAGGSEDLRPAFVAGGALPHLTRTFKQPGLHIVGMVTTHASSELPWIRFNEYIATEGLTLAIDARARAGTTKRPGREIYSRRAKALVQVGPASPRDAMLATRPIGLTLEIVPERNPYALASDRRLPVRVLFEGRPLAGALVKLTSLEFDAKPLATARTNREGRAAFRVPPVGSWLVNVIWSKPVSSPLAQFETIFSSLTFGYSASRQR